MEKNHNFLFTLFEEKRGWKNRDTLRKASKEELSVTLRLLFCISVGHIPIRRSDFAVIVKSKRRIVLADLKYSFARLRHDSRSKILEFLLKFASLYRILFHPIFS